MKQLKLKQGVKDVLGIIIFYLIIILGVILVSARLENLQQKTIDQNGYRVVENQD